MNTPPSTSPMSPPRPLRFADRFWGAEDAGFDVLMELMKAGKHTGNELLELFKMRWV